MSTSDITETSTPVRLENGNIEIKLTIPWPSIDKVCENKVLEAVSQAELPGFRKGKAPRSLVEPKLDRSDLISRALSDLLPNAYSIAVKTYNVKPILYPQIRIDKGKTGEDWEFTATTCEAPAVKLPDYKSDLSSIKTAQDQSKLSAAIEYLRNKSETKIPDILIEEETNHRLSALIENITKIGLSLEKYLQTKKITAEDLKAQTAKSARQDLETEFILAHIQTNERLSDRDKTIEFIQTLIPTIK